MIGSPETNKYKHIDVRKSPVDKRFRAWTTFYEDELGITAERKPWSVRIPVCIACDTTSSRALHAAFNVLGIDPKERKEVDK